MRKKNQVFKYLSPTPAFFLGTASLTIFSPSPPGWGRLQPVYHTLSLLLRPPQGQGSHTYPAPAWVIPVALLPAKLCHANPIQRAIKHDWRDQQFILQKHQENALYFMQFFQSFIKKLTFQYRIVLKKNLKSWNALIIFWCLILYSL